MKPFWFCQASNHNAYDGFFGWVFTTTIIIYQFQFRATPKYNARGGFIFWGFLILNNLEGKKNWLEMEEVIYI